MKGVEVSQRGNAFFSWLARAHHEQSIFLVYNRIKFQDGGGCFSYGHPECDCIHVVLSKRVLHFLD